MDGRAHGVDVSHNNGAIDWTGAAAAGVQFAFVKATQGADPNVPWYTDSQFEANWQGANEVGILRGAYHFIGLPLTTTPAANWNDDLHSQIDHFLQVLGPLKAGDLPPVLDLEDGDSTERWQSLIANDRNAALGVVRELIDYTTARLNGLKPIIYTGGFWSSQLSNPDPENDDMPFAAWPLWIAQYPQVHTPELLPGKPGDTDSGEAGSFDEYGEKLDGHTPRHVPSVWGGVNNPKWQFWQFSEFGKISQLCAGYIDLDVFNGSIDDLQALCVAS